MQPFPAVLLVHIGAGSVALIASLAALYAPKGGPLHRRAGRIFVAAMLAVGVSALTLAVLRPNAFLLTVGLFSLYLVTAGWEAARPGRIGARAMAAAIAMLVAAACMIGIAGAVLLGWPGAARLVGRLPPAALLLFGAIGAAFAVQDLRARWSAGGAEPHRRRVARHLARMGGAAIAAWTAFVVVNARFLPPPVAWIGPTLLLLPVILYWQRRVLDGRGAVVPRPS